MARNGMLASLRGGGMLALVRGCNSTIVRNSMLLRRFCSPGKGSPNGFNKSELHKRRQAFKSEFQKDLDEVRQEISVTKTKIGKFKAEAKRREDIYHFRFLVCSFGLTVLIIGALSRYEFKGQIEGEESIVEKEA